MSTRKRWLSWLLAVVMVIACLPVYARAEETVTVEQVTAVEEKNEITKDGYEIIFTTFEDLQQLASETYSELTYAFYRGTGPLEIKSDLTLPENLLISAWGDTIKIPAGVTLTANDSIVVNTLIVEGTLNNDKVSMEVDKELTVTGVVNCFMLMVYSHTSLSGIDKVNGTVYCRYQITDMAALKEAVARANAQNYPRVHYALSLPDNALVLDESITIPPNCGLGITQPVTIQEGCTLKMNGGLGIGNTLKVNGSLVNDGSISITSDENGKLEVSGSLVNNGSIFIFNANKGGELEITGGSYSGEGDIVIINATLETLEAVLPGLDLTIFEIEESGFNGENSWHLTPKETTHTHSYSSVVTAPTCVNQGYTTYTCACGDSYVDNYVDATGEHVYTDSQDAVCDTCGGALRLPTAPDDVDYTPMYRLYNPNSGEHFYTGSAEETENLAAAGWQYEGVAWNAPVSSGDPVHRLFNPNNGDHHYTGSMDEVNNLTAVGWKYEGVCWNSPATGIPVYRLFNPNADCGSHHYTTSAEERDNLVSIGWKYEGIGWNGVA